MPPLSGCGSTGPCQRSSAVTLLWGSLTSVPSRLGETEPPAGALGPRSDQAIGDDGDEGDRDAGDDAPPGIRLGERDVDLLPQVAGAEQRGDHPPGEDRKSTRLNSSDSSA